MKRFLSLALTICALCAATAVAGCKKKEVSTADEYEIFAIYDGEEGKLTATVDFTYRNDTGNEISDLKFNLYGNAYREDAALQPVSASYTQRAYYAGKDYGGMKITEVENCAGWEVAGEDMNLLTVNLPSAQKITVKIDYELELAKVNHRTGITPDTVNLGNFYPILCAYDQSGFVECPYYSCGDPFLSECADYTVTFDLPPEYTAATSGKIVEESMQGDRKRVCCRLENARDFAAVLSDKFHVATAQTHGVEVSYYYVSDNSPEASLKAATESLEYFCGTFGDYIYPTLSVVQTGFCYGGMEYPALTMISDALDSDDKIYTIVHENAHQWWYAMVGSDQLNCAWQDEGLAEYSALMFFENNPSYSFTRVGLVGNATKAYRAYFTVYSQIFDGTDTSMNRNLSQYKSEYEYTNISYGKGLIMFETLRNSIGDEKFLGALKKYFAENKCKIAGYEQLYSSFIACGTDLEGFFDSFIKGKIVI